MSQSPYDQVVALSANVVSNISVPLYYERVIVTSEIAGADVYVSTDGTPVATTPGNFGAVVLPNAWRIVGNDQPRQPLVTQAEGSTVHNKGFQGATTPNLEPLASGAPTYVSLLCSSGGNVGLEFV